MQPLEPAAETPEPKVLAIPVLRPLAWLADGWRDLAYAPGVSLLHGILIALGGWVIAAISLLWVPLLPGAFSGFVLVAPILATGLYEMSRCRERGAGRRSSRRTGTTAPRRRTTRTSRRARSWSSPSPAPAAGEGS